MSRRNTQADKARRRAAQQERRERATVTSIPPARRPGVLEVQLTRVHIPEDAQDEEYIGWAAQ
ncbi:MAG TPA: hypothetical protein VF940_22425 [Streptosporangiaceae bacterium]